MADASGPASLQFPAMVKRRWFQRRNGRATGGPAHEGSDLPRTAGIVNQNVTLDGPSRTTFDMRRRRDYSSPRL